MAIHDVAGGHFYTYPCGRVPELALIGHVTFSKAYQGLDEHDHGPSLEVLSIRRGTQTFSAAGGEYTMRGGECVVFPAGLAHSTGGRPQGKAELRWIQIDLGRDRPFFGDAVHEPLRDELARLGVQIAQAPDPLWDVLRRLYDATSGPDHARRDSEVVSLCLTFCHRLLEVTSTIAGRSPSPAIAQALAFMRTHLGDRVAVSSMARASGYAESAFIEAFAREVGTPPAEHFLRMKLERAAECLSGSTASVTEIAGRLGFSSTQYFATAFKRHHLATPSAWRRAHPARRGVRP